MSNSPNHYRLSPKARTDLEEIWRYSASTWSIDQADSYIDQITASLDTIVSFPTMARERDEFDPPVRIHPHGTHLTIYRIEDGHIRIIRILSSRQNWSALLDAIDA